MSLYMLYSKAHSRDGIVLWWGPDSRGYTEDIDYAGKYSEEEAMRIQADGTTTAAIPATEVQHRLIARRTIDPGWSNNGAALKDLIAEADNRRDARNLKTQPTTDDASA